MKRLSILALVLGSFALTAETSTARAGAGSAKELFYDPIGGGVTRNSASPPPAASRPGGTSSGSAGRGSRPSVDRAGRRALKPTGGDSKPSEQSLLGLSYWIELQQVGQETGTQVSDRRTFRSGERIRLHFRSNAEGSISLVQLGASGTSQVLFPDPSKGLTDVRLAKDVDRVLPEETAWFRFDDNAGTERILVFFARRESDLRQFPIKPRMDTGETLVLAKSAEISRGSKDLLIETETQKVSEVGTYGVNLMGQPVVLQISLDHR